MVKRSNLSPEAPRRALSAPRREASPPHSVRRGNHQQNISRQLSREGAWGYVRESQESVGEMYVSTARSVSLSNDNLNSSKDWREESTQEEIDEPRRSLFAETPTPRASMSDAGPTDLVPRILVSSPLSISSASSASSNAVGKCLDLMDNDDDDLGQEKFISASAKISVLLFAEESSNKQILQSQSSSDSTCCTTEQKQQADDLGILKNKSILKRRPAPDPSAFEFSSGFSEDEDSRYSRGEDDRVSPRPTSPIGGLHAILEAPLSNKSHSPACASPMKKPRESRSELMETRVLVTRQTHGNHKNKIETTISCFDLGPRLGTGTFSQVFAAKRKKDGIRVAIKRVNQPFRTYRGREAALVEARTLAALHSEYVIDFYDAWQQYGHLYLQLELCEFGSVAAIISAVIATTTQSAAHAPILNETHVLWRFISDVSRGLDHVHSQGFVHLDLKPANVLLTPTALKLADFGLATAIGRRLADGLEGDARYLAPELLLLDDSLSVDPAADLFSLGLTLFELTKQATSKARTHLPTSGPAWHGLRSGNVQASPHHSDDLNTILASVLRREPSTRSTAAQIANHPRAKQAANANNIGGWLDLASNCNSSYSDESSSISNSPPDQISLSPLPTGEHLLLPSLFPPLPSFDSPNRTTTLPLQQAPSPLLHTPSTF